MTCTNPLIDIFEVLSMRTPRQPGGDTTELSTPADKAIVFDGMKFESSYTHDPAETIDCSCPNPANPSASKLIFNLTIHEALMLLPVGQGSTIAPAYLPNIVQGIFQSGDTADRMLWKRNTHMRIFGLNGSPCSACPFLEITDIMTNAGPVAVKSRCRIDDRHALYFVRNFVHDIFLPFPAAQPCGFIDCDQCNGAGCDNTLALCGDIPILHDFTARIFYHTRK